MNYENKKILKELLKDEILPNVSNKDYVETLGLKNEFTKIRTIKLLDSYEELKWWLSTNIKAKAYGQLFESKLIIPFDDMCKGVNKILERSVFTHEYGIYLEKVRNKVTESVLKSLNDKSPEL